MKPYRVLALFIAVCLAWVCKTQNVLAPLEAPAVPLAATQMPASVQPEAAKMVLPPAQFVAYNDTTAPVTAPVTEGTVRTLLVQLPVALR